MLPIFGQMYSTNITKLKMKKSAFLKINAIYIFAHKA